MSLVVKPLWLEKSMKTGVFYLESSVAEYIKDKWSIIANCSTFHIIYLFNYEIYATRMNFSCLLCDQYIY